MALRHLSAVSEKPVSRRTIMRCRIIHTLDSWDGRDTFYRDKNVIVLCSERVTFKQNRSKRNSEMPLTNQLEQKIS